MSLNKAQRIDKIYREAKEKLEKLILKHKELVMEYKKKAEEAKIKRIRQKLN